MKLATALFCALALLTGCNRAPRYTFLLTHDGTVVWRGDLETGEVTLIGTRDGKFLVMSVPGSAR